MPLLFLLTLLCLASCSPAATISFLAPVRAFAVGTVGQTYFIPRGFTYGDFNRDGKPDLAFVPMRSGPYDPIVSLGNGDGTFRNAPASSVLLSPGTAISDLVTSDFNGDGNLDLAVDFFSSPAGRSIATYLGEGDGRLRVAALTPWYGSGAGRLSIADVNRDGKPDIIAGQFVLLGVGNGTFSPRATFDGAAVLTADFNRDEKPDTLLTLASGDLAVCLGNGDGTFGNKIPLATPFAADSYIAGDFNGDGIPDLAVEPAAEGGQPVNLVVLLGNGNGTFRPPVITASVPIPIFTAADFNRDGKLDLVAGNSVLVGLGDGAFRAPVYFGATGNICGIAGGGSLCGADWAGIVAADFNGDGLADLGTAATFPRAWVPVVGPVGAVLLNDSPGDGFLQPGVSSATGLGPVAVDSLVTAFGENLANVTESAVGPPWPTTLGGVRVHVTYRHYPGAPETDFLAPLTYVSPGQINYLLPSNGMSITSGSFVFVSMERVGSPFRLKGIAVPIRTLAPGLFTLNALGIAAASALRVSAGDTRTNVPVAACANAGCVALPINITQGSVYLSLYGTGFSTASTAGVTCRVGQTNVEVTYAGPQFQIPGLDQVNILLPAHLAGIGETGVECAFGPGVKTNSVRVWIE